VFWRSQAERFRRFESQILTAAEFVLTLSAEDETTLRREGVSNIITIPPPRESVREYPRSSNSRESTLAVFVGRLDMEVNREAFFVFANQVWPRIPMEVRAKVRVVFAGGVPDEDICRRAREDGLDLHAQPSDLEAEQLFEEADIFLSPVQSGTGIKIKTLEAMARGKAMIGFPQAFRGVPVEHDKHALVAASAEDFARSFEALVSDAAKRQKFGQAAREFIRLNFSPKILGKQLIAVYEKVAREYIQKQQHGQPVLL
jgi:glycosyltransferase involved in cell wall biosynthesis